MGAAWLSLTSTPVVFAVVNPEQERQKAQNWFCSFWQQSVVSTPGLSSRSWRQIPSWKVRPQIMENSFARKNNKQIQEAQNITKCKSLMSHFEFPKKWQFFFWSTLLLNNTFRFFPSEFIFHKANILWFELSMFPLIFLTTIVESKAFQLTWIIFFNCFVT